mmetsp:Transcript_19612/g.59334  ORF Transcript_19612/g.59334 Transcript_19612/m.59334 type:complete len:228 (+) Transcript_19612:879-1562(+)
MALTRFTTSSTLLSITSSAPSALSCSICSLRRTTLMVLTPRWRAYCTSCRPKELKPAPCSSHLPSGTAAASSSPTTVTGFTKNWQATRSLTPSGTRTTTAASATAYWAQVSSSVPTTTLSPTDRPVTPGPSLEIVPTPSLPAVKGIASSMLRYVPPALKKSVGLIGRRCTRIRTWPSLGSGMSISLISMLLQLSLILSLLSDVTTAAIWRPMVQTLVRCGCTSPAAA